MTVPASMGTQRGANLFHSFGAFNIGSRESLYFTPTGSSGAISNVISRVTGGAGSTINGVLGSTISGANVFLINPSGIVFGPNAQLDISGSFYASTANYLKLADGGRFDATTPANTSLTVAAPAAFGFLGASPAAITVNSSRLAVPVGKILGLIGGDITVKDGARLRAPGGTVHLVSGASTGEASFTSGALDVGSFAKLGVISVRGSSIEVSEPTGQNSGGGTVYIRGGAFTLHDSLILASTDAGNSGGLDLSISGHAQLVNGSEINTASSGAGGAGDIAVATGTMSMNNATITTLASGDGNAGDIRIRTRDLALANRALIESGAEASGIGRGGAITIDATGTVSLDGRSIIESIAFGPEGSGNIRINATHLALANGSYFSTAVFGDGNAGNIRIGVRDLALTNGAFIDSGSARAPGVGHAGNITIDAAGTVSLDGISSIESIAYGSGRGGDIRINATHLALVNGSYLSTTAFGDGNAGNIRISTRDLALASRAHIDSGGAEDGRGLGGNITIDAAGTVGLDGGSSIESIASGPGDAGSIRINATHLALTNGSYTTTEAQSSGRGGDITIKTNGSTSLSDSFVSSQAFADGDAGNIQISTSDLILANRAFIDSGGAEAPARGSGGSITIDATGTTSLDGRSSIRAIAYGPGGTDRIAINTTHLALGNGSYISTETQSSEPGGSIFITAPGSIALNGASLITSATKFENGDAGNIQITAGNFLLANRSAISTSSLLGATGDAGSISVNAGSKLQLLDGSSIATSTQNAAGGNINVIARDLVYLENSTISSSVQGGSGNGGNIFIDPTFLVLNNSSIIANAFGGDGGSITITAGNLFLSPGSVIDASSEKGVSGTIVISSPIVDLSGSLVTLPSSYLDTSTLLANQCAARLAGNASSLVLSRRGGMPVEPDGLLSGAGSIGSPPARSAATPAEHPLLPVVASYRTFDCARRYR